MVLEYFFNFETKAFMYLHINASAVIQFFCSKISDGFIKDRDIVIRYKQ